MESKAWVASRPAISTLPTAPVVPAITLLTKSYLERSSKNAATSPIFLDYVPTGIPNLIIISLTFNNL